jgi:pimeloyl-ACP methyl ester carboxylesterase
MPQIDVDGLRIGYEAAGSGPPVVLVPGFVGDGPATWRRQLEDLSDEFTVVAWDPPGAGRSSDPPDTFRISEFAGCLAGFLGALGLASPHIVGLSFGGILALELFRRFPGVPRSLVLAGAYAGWSGSLGTEAAAERLRRSLDAADLPDDEFAAALLPSMFSSSATDSAIASFSAAVRARRPAGFRAMARASAEADLRDVLPRIDVPTLVLHGSADTRAPLAVAEQLHASIPGSRLVVLDGVGHVSPVEAPERFTREVRAFLRTVG